MMTAVLRHAAARRLCSSMVQRAQPAVAEGRHRLGPRLMHTEEEITRKIQQKKEELYDVICKAEQSFWTSSFRNKQLLLQLSTQVKPRPGDTKWQLMRVSKRVVNVVDAAGLVALTYVVSFVVLGIGRFVLHSQAFHARMMEERHEQEKQSQDLARERTSLDARRHKG